MLQRAGHTYKEMECNQHSARTISDISSSTSPLFVGSTVSHFLALRIRPSFGTATNNIEGLISWAGRIFLSLE
jgi:hypothetical protein